MREINGHNKRPAFCQKYREKREKGDDCCLFIVCLFCIQAGPMKRRRKDTEEE